MAKQQSRVARWNLAIAKIEEGVATLTALNTEYEDWKSNLESAENAENLMQGETYFKLEELEMLDVEYMLSDWEDPIQQLKDADLPRGFGRD